MRGDGGSTTAVLMNDSSLVQSGRAEMFRVTDLAADRRHPVVVAIDFGTSGTGMIFGLRRQVDGQIEVKSPNWNDEKNGSLSKEITSKIPSCVLFNPDRELIAFGERADQLFKNGEIDGEAIDRHWLFFTKFKMSLARFCEWRDLQSAVICAENGEKMRLMDVMIAVLKYLRQRAMLCLDPPKKSKSSSSTNNDVYGLPVSESEIRWVLTVPAIWSTESKQIMRVCAERAGMGESDEQRTLLYEPEAAAIAMHSEFEKNKEQYGLEKGDRFMIVDCGGGTVDIVTHEWLAPYEVNEVLAPSGGAWGSRTIEDEMANLFGVIFEREKIDRIRDEEPSVWAQLLSEAVTAKELFHRRADEDDSDSDSDIDSDNDSDEKHSRSDGGHKDSYLGSGGEEKSDEIDKDRSLHESMHYINLPESFVDRMGKKSIRRSVKKYREQIGLGVTVGGKGRMTLGLSEALMRQLFDVAISGITQHMTELFEKNHSVLFPCSSKKSGLSLSLKRDIIPLMNDTGGSLKFVCLVGGFAESKYLENRIREMVDRTVNIRDEVQHKVRVIVAMNPGSAVMRGAASLEYIRTLVKKRVLRNTYGIRVGMPLKEVLRWERQPSKEDLRPRVYESRRDVGVKYVKYCFKSLLNQGSLVEPGFYVESTDRSTYLDQSRSNCTVYMSAGQKGHQLMPLDDEQCDRMALGGKKREVIHPDWYDNGQGWVVKRYQFGHEIELEMLVTFHSPGHEPLTLKVDSFPIEESLIDPSSVKKKSIEDSDIKRDSEEQILEAIGTDAVSSDPSASPSSAKGANDAGGGSGSAAVASDAVAVDPAVKTDDSEPRKSVAKKEEVKSGSFIPTLKRLFSKKDT